MGNLKFCMSHAFILVVHVWMCDVCMKYSIFTISTNSGVT